MNFTVASTVATNINVQHHSKSGSIYEPFKRLENSCSEIREELDKLRLRPLREELRKQWIIGQKVGEQCHAKSQVYVLTSSEEFTGYLALCNSFIPTLPQDIKRRVKMPVIDQYSNIIFQCNSCLDFCNEYGAIKETILKSLCLLFQEVVFSTQYHLPAYLYIEDMNIKIPIILHERLH